MKFHHSYMHKNGESIQAEFVDVIILKLHKEVTSKMSKV